MSLLSSSNRGKLSIDDVAPRILSRQLRKGHGEGLSQRRKVFGLSLAAAGAMGLVSAYQMGLIRHLPEPPLPGFDADKVDASDEAYEWLSMPDGVIGLASYAGTAMLAAVGGSDRARRLPWLPLLLAGKVAADASQAARLTKDQWTKHEAFCLWCLLAAGATAAAVPYAFAEARTALRHLLRR